MIFAREWWYGCIVVALLAAPAAPQGIAFPSNHYGALGFPPHEKILEFGFSTDRFTELTKPKDISEGKGREYVHRQTEGFNSFHARFSLPWRYPQLVLGFAGHYGWIAEKPSRLLQNDFRHRDAGLEFIPVGQTGSGPFYGVGVSADRWFSPSILQTEGLRLIAPMFVGTEFAASSAVHDWAIRAGIHSTRWTIVNKDIPSVSVLVRKGLRVTPSHWKKPLYGQDDLANTYSLATVVLRLPLDQWWDPPAIVPAAEFGLTWHSGFYRGFYNVAEAQQFALLRAESPSVHLDPPRLPEKLCTLAFSWAGGDVVLETYNDSCGNKDIGPTFGARFYARIRNSRGAK